MIARRTFLTGSFAALTMPRAAEAQQVGTPPRIGLLSNGSPTAAPTPQLAAFRQGLRELGWIEGQTVTIEYRWAEGNPDRLPALLADLIKLKVDVIVLTGSPAIRAAAATGTTIPIIFVVLADPVAAGFVRSLARPDRNMTGLASDFEELITKQLQLLKEALPKLSRIALFYYRGSSAAILSAAEMAARKLGLTARAFQVAAVAELENVFNTARSDGAGAVQVLPSPFFATVSIRRQLIEFAARYRLPAVYEFKNYVDDGGLMSYGPSINEMHRGMASYVDLILKGVKPSDLPIKRPTTFELAINLRTAKALGLTIPSSLLMRADQVIE